MAYSLDAFKTETKKTEEWLGKELSQIHTGVANPALLDGVFIEAYGARTALSHVASVSIEDPRTIRVSPWDKSHIKEIEKAVMTANLGVGTAVDDSGIRVTFPPLTTERRQAYGKLVREKLEDARIRIRNSREDSWNEIQKKEKDGLLTEDEKFRGKEELQKLVDETNKKLETLSEKKEKELLS